LPWPVKVRKKRSQPLPPARHWHTVKSLEQLKTDGAGLAI
jgi:hypothetical protein